MTDNGTNHTSVQLFSHEILRAKYCRSTQFSSRCLNGAGKDKLMYVKGQLTNKGYRIDIDEIKAAIRELTMIGGETDQLIVIKTKNDYEYLQFG